MATPTHGEVFAKLIEDLAHAQEGAALLAHLTRAQSSSAKDTALADGWIAVSEMFKRVSFQVIKLGQGKLQ
jgi:hypothetical protein